MHRNLVLATASLSAALAAIWIMSAGNVTGRAQERAAVPKFQYDPTFPQPLPENWAIGAIGGMAVDSRDHVWVLHRPGPLQGNERFSGAGATPPKAECCIPAPPVLEFDAEGRLISSWGGPGAGYEWPQIEHGIFVDHKDNVWIAGSGEKDAQVLKFTRQGKFIAQFGRQGRSRGSADIAYGNTPDDKDPGPYGPAAPPAQQFRLPHNVAVSRDGFVYVADRPNDRIQVFRKDGMFVKEGFIAPKTLLAGSASGLAFSPDQRFLYVIDGANHHVWILRRDTLEVVDRFGQQGIFGGSLNVPHALATDSQGNVYVGEISTGGDSSASSTNAWDRPPADCFRPCGRSPIP
jgi:hypothetical protein